MANKRTQVSIITLQVETIVESKLHMLAVNTYDVFISITTKYSICTLLLIP